MELFDTHFVWFGHVLVVSGLKMLFYISNRYKKADAIVSYSNVHVAVSCVCIVNGTAKDIPLNTLPAIHLVISLQC